MFKRVLLVIVLAMTLTLSGCSWLSNNSDYDSKDRNRTSDTDIASGNDIRLIDVQVDARNFSTLDISTCPVAVQVGDNSCGVKVTP